MPSELLWHLGNLPTIHNSVAILDRRHEWKGLVVVEVRMAHSTVDREDTPMVTAGRVGYAGGNVTEAKAGR
jgi:hypothetical protein